MSQNFHTSYVETLGKLETQYCKLKVSFGSFIFFMDNTVLSKQLSSLIQKVYMVQPCFGFLLLGYTTYFVIVHMYYGIFCFLSGSETTAPEWFN